MQVLSWVLDHLDPIGTFFTGICGGWWGYAAKARRLRVEADENARRMVVGMANSAMERAATLQRLLDAYTADLDALRRNRWAILDVLSEVQAQAIAARLIVHQLDDRLGLPERQFTPLPSFPPEWRTGAQAADTAEPRAETRPENQPVTSAEAGSS